MKDIARSRIGLASCVCLALALAGCSLISSAPAPAPSLFLLQPVFARDASPARKDAAPEIAIALPEARPGLDGSRMAYVTRPYEIRYFARHAWAEPPARLLAPLLFLALERSSRLRPVQSRAGVVPALRLETEIVALQQEFDVSPSQLRFVLHAELLDAGAGRVIATTELEALEPAESEDPYGGVVAANRAVARVLEQLAQWCDAQAPREPAAR